MLRTRIIPCLLFDGKALVKGVRFKNHRYIGDPINAVRLFNDMQVDELIILDISITNQHKMPNFELLRDLATECFMPFTYGGGIADIEDMRRIFKIGVEKIAINSYAFENPNFIKLKVLEALQDDAYKGIARIDTEVMRALGLQRGDIIYLLGHKIEGNKITKANEIELKSRYYINL